MSECRVNFMWDNDAYVWIATSDDVCGLVLEHASFDTLVERVRQAIPELLVLEGRTVDNIFIDYSMSRQEMLVANG